jgi:hypothetical protein
MTGGVALSARERERESVRARAGQPGRVAGPSERAAGREVARAARPS